MIVIPPLEQPLPTNRNWMLDLPKPKPSLGLEAYSCERQMCLAGSPQKAENYERYLKAQRGDSVDYLPIKLDIENVSRCNFHCKMCQVSDWPNLKRSDDMSYEDFVRLIDSQYGLVEVKLQGMGEPTLARDNLFAMIRYLRSKHIWVRTITNASLLHLNENFKKMIDSNPNEVQISIDGPTKVIFETIRRGSKFERIVENCRLINEYAISRGPNPTKMWVVVQRDNIANLLALVDLAAEIQFKNLVFSLELQDWGQDKWQEVNKGLSANESFTRQLAQALIDRGMDYGIEVAFWMATSKYKTGNMSTLCPWPFERAYISSDMRVVPCCMIANPDVADLGDAHDFTTQWQGKLYSDFRRAHIEGKIPRVCQGCYEESHGGIPG